MTEFWKGFSGVFDSEFLGGTVAIFLCGGVMVLAVSAIVTLMMAWESGWRPWRRKP